jgi:benzoate/toluate 1,2-dioxygenase subunit beta
VTANGTTTLATTATGAAGAVDPRAVEQFLYREARLADEHDYDAWEALWTDDALYWVPAGGDDTDPMRTMSIIHDNRQRISTRIRQLKTGRRHSQTPASRLRRIISNIEIIGPLGGDGPHPADLVTEANFLLFESRERGNEIWGGRITYRLRHSADELKLAYKKIALVDNARVLPTLAFLI